MHSGYSDLWRPLFCRSNRICYARCVGVFVHHTSLVCTTCVCEFPGRYVMQAMYAGYVCAASSDCARAECVCVHSGFLADSPACSHQWLSCVLLAYIHVTDYLFCGNELATFSSMELSMLTIMRRSSVSLCARSCTRLCVCLHDTVLCACARMCMQA